VYGSVLSSLVDVLCVNQKKQEPLQGLEDTQHQNIKIHI